MSSLLLQYCFLICFIIIMLIIIAVLLGSAVLGCYYYFVYWIRPRKILKWYQYTLEVLGYNVLVFPYQPFKIIMLENQKHNQAQHGDAFYDEKHCWKNYDLVLTNTSHMITIILINPRLIKYFFAPDKNIFFHKSDINKIGFKMTLGNTMILSQGQTWKKKRKALSELFNFQFIKRNIPKMKSICEQILQKFQHRTESISSNTCESVYKIQLLLIIGEIISNIVVRCFFGNETLNQTIDGVPINIYLSQILTDSRRHSTDYLVILFGQRVYEWGLLPKYKKLKNNIATLKEAVRKIIQLRILKLKDQNNNCQKYTDIFQAMWHLKSKKENKSLEAHQINEIIEQFCAFMAAGNDSTSSFTNMVIYYLYQNTQVQKKLRGKIEENFKSMKDVTFQKIRDMDYLQWVLLETTRMYGPATSIMLRQATRDTSIDNVPIIKGTGIKIELLPNHYNEKYFKNPQKFDPLRWFDLQQQESYSFGGFSFGARTCIGKQLAYLSSKIIIISLLMRYKKIEVQNPNKITFSMKTFYSPSSFESLLTKKSPSKTDKVA